MQTDGTESGVSGALGFFVAAPIERPVTYGPTVRVARRQVL